MFMSLSRRIDAQRHLLSELLEPTQRQLNLFQLSFLGEVAALRAYLNQPTAPTIDQLRAAHQSGRRILDGLGTNAGRIGPEIARELATLRERVAVWDAAPVALMSGRLSLQALQQRFTQQSELADNVIAKASQLEGAVWSRTRRLTAELQSLERGRLMILAGLFPLALLGTVLTAWFARRALQTHERVLRAAAHDALLRDAMAALTGEQVLPSALDRIATNAMLMGDADGAFVERSDDARAEVEIVAAVGHSAPPTGVRVPFVSSITDEIVRAGTPAINVDLSARSDELRQIVGDQWERCSCFAVALKNNGDVDGALVLVYPDRPIRIEEDLTWRLEALSAWAALALHRQGLAAELDAERARLEAVVKEMPVGVVLAEAPSGRIVLYNRQAVEMWGSPPPPPQAIELYADWKLFRLDGQPYEVQERPLVRSILNGEVVQSEEAEIERIDGTRRVVLISAVPVRDASGTIIASVATVSDISEEKNRERAALFLDEISRQLASSLDYDATLEAVLGLLVPRIGDLASIHHRLDDTVIRRCAAAAADPRVNEVFENVDKEFPLPLPSADPVAVAIRTGKSQLREDIDDELLQTIARDERQLDWLRSIGPKSEMVVPLTVRGKTIGALRIVSVKPTRHFDCNDLAFTEEIGRRAALAIDNAQLFHTVNQAGRVSRFLAEAALSLSASLEYEEVLRRVTRLAVPFFRGLHHCILEG
jgi:PAS domain-containing protein